MEPHPPAPSDLKKLRRTQPRPARGWRRLVPFALRREDNHWKVQIYWRQFLLTIALLIVCGWIGAATAAYAFVKYQRGFSEVRYTDIMLLPMRWQAYQTARGDFFIKTAKQDLENKNYREAFYNLRVGVLKSPANKEGRQLLAQFYILWRRPDLAQQTLLDGLPFAHDDIPYLQSLFTFLLQQQQDEKVIAISRELLGTDTTLSDRNRMVAIASATAAFFRGNYDQADDLIRVYRLEGTRDGRLLAARVEWDRGYRDQALTRLSGLSADFPNDEAIYAQTVEYLREAGRDREARNESFIRTLGNPANARARIDLLYAYQKEGDTAAVKTGIEEIFRDFSSNAPALLALADFAANKGDPALALRIYRHCKTHNLNWEGAALMTVEAHVVAKQYQSAIELVRELLKENPDWAKRYYSVFNGLQAIAQYGLGDPESAQLFLNNFLSQQSNVRADNLIAVAKRLSAIGARAQARQVLTQAVAADPLNQAALTGLIQLDLELKNSDALATNVRKLLGMRKPSRDVLRDAQRQLGSDLFLFSAERTALLNDLRNALNAPRLRSS